MRSQLEPEEMEISDGTLSNSHAQYHNPIGLVSEEETKSLFTFSNSCSLFLRVYQNQLTRSNSIFLLS